jgi:hypothetical protein
MIKIEQSAITRHEDKSYLTPPLGALMEFYGAFNNRDLGKPATNWAQSDGAVVDKGWVHTKNY